ncbi:MAG TPA: ribonuclease H-like domain-containing protein [Candidatus Kapabacteria bacterium]|jgi:uncharacterized protein YprB with RNaseH-like and TPR domain|nr:ribonuclease H-like domain-containing protein [Candidatus Kapabacteria bacterium]
MLTSTFCHIPGVGRRREERIWEEGVRCWDDCLEMELSALFGNRAAAAEAHLFESQEALRQLDAHFFGRSVPASEQWRLFPELRSRIAYLDIETTGLGSHLSHITTAVLFDGQRIRHYVYGENLRDLQDDIFDYDVLVTYNGKCFDIPFIENYFLIKLPQAHIDLRFVFHGLGMRGGLKGVERQLGLDRGELDGVDGYFAVLLWQDYTTRRNPKALETLIAYNIQDTVNLEHLLVSAYNLKIADSPFEISHAQALPTRTPVLPFEPDMDTIGEIRRRVFGRSMPFT